MYTGSLTASNRADWIVDVSALDADTNDAIDITDATIVVTARDAESDNKGYQRLYGSTSDGIITFPDPTDTSKFRWTFPRATMAGIPAGDYDFGATITQDGVTTQIFAGKLYVVDGVVP